MDPVWRILKHQGRGLEWLARKTGYAHLTVRAIACGARRPTAEFRAKCADALDMPEDVLFHGGATPSESTQPEGTPDLGSTGPRLHRGLDTERSDAPEEVAIGHSA